MRVVELVGIGPGPFAAMLLADLDPALLAASRPHNTYLADRRPELYADLVMPEQPL